MEIEEAVLLTQGRGIERNADVGKLFSDDFGRDIRDMGFRPVQFHHLHGNIVCFQDVPSADQQARLDRFSADGLG